MISAEQLIRTLLQHLVSQRRSVLAILLMGAAFSALAFWQIPLQLLPEVRYPQVRIIGDLPGQTSLVIEESINEPMEVALQSVEGVTRIESRSGDGRAYIDIFFEPDYNLDRALQNVSQAAQRARATIPSDFPEPRIFAVSTMEEPAILFAFSGNMAPSEIRGYLRGNLLPRLRAISGVEAVYIGREEIPELVIDIHPARQIMWGLELDEIESTLLQATRGQSSGAIRATDFEGLAIVGLNGWQPDVLEAQNVRLPKAGTVRLSEVAHIGTLASEDRLSTRYNGSPAVLVSVHRSRNAHTTRVANQVQKIVGQLGHPDIKAHALFDDSVVVQSATRSVLAATGGGALLAILLLGLFLKGRRNLGLIAMIIGLSMLLSIGVLSVLGLTLNLLTMAGLLLSVGLGLDYAIVFFDRLDRLDGDEGPVEAMIGVFGPLLGALFTTLVAILPFLLVRGLVAMLLAPLIITIAVSALISFLCAAILLPVLSASTSGARDKPLVKLPLTKAQHPLVGAALLVVLLLSSWGLARYLPFEVLPTIDDGFISIRITHPAGIPNDQMDEIARAAEGKLLAIDGTKSVFTTVGGYFREGLPSFRPGTSNFMVNIDTMDGDLPSAQWAADARASIADLSIEGMRISVTPPRIRGVQTRLAEADLIVVLSSQVMDLASLADHENRIIQALESIHGLEDIQRVRAGVSPRWAARPQSQAIAFYNIDYDTLEKTVEYALGGRVLRQRVANGEPLALRARYDRRFAGSPSHLNQIQVLNRDRTPVLIQHIVDFELIEEPTHIERREGQRVVRIASQLSPDAPDTGDVAAAVERAMERLELPDDVAWWIEGELDAMNETRRTFTVALLLALLAVMTTLIIQYGRLSFTIGSLIAIPISGSGALFLLTLLGQPLDAIVLAGILISIGIIANNTILILSQTNELQSKGQGIKEALATATALRLRPILLTTASTILGMSPLLLGGSQVFGLLQPLAIALTGALLMAIPVNCILLPSLIRTFEYFGKHD